MLIRKYVVASAIAVAGIPAAFAAGDSASARAESGKQPLASQAGIPQSVAQKSYYYWLHPKLGVVKVDRATNAMVTGQTSRQPRTNPQGGQP